MDGVLTVRRSQQPSLPMTAAVKRWSASPLWRERSQAVEGSVCATMWPTRTLADRERWFDELYVWTEGFQASTTQRAVLVIRESDATEYGYATWTPSSSGCSCIRWSRTGSW